MAIVDNWGEGGWWRGGGQVSLKLMSREAAGRLTRADRSRLLLRLKLFQCSAVMKVDKSP